MMLPDLCVMLCFVSASAAMAQACELSGFRISQSGQQASSIQLEWNSTCRSSSVLQVQWRADGTPDWTSGMGIKGNETTVTVDSLSCGFMHHFRLVLAGGSGLMLTTSGETENCTEAIQTPTGALRAAPNSWAEVALSGNVPGFRSGHRVTAARGLLYVFGGHGQGETS